MYSQIIVSEYNSVLCINKFVPVILITLLHISSQHRLDVSNTSVYINIDNFVLCRPADNNMHITNT